MNSKLGGAAFGQGGEVLLLGAQGVGDSDQRRALLGEAVLQRPHLVADADAGGLQPADLAAEILGGDSRRVHRLAGRGGQVGGPRRQRRLGLAQLGLGQVGGFRHHPRLPIDRVGHRRGPGVEGDGQGVELTPLAAERFHQVDRGARGAGGGVGQLLGLLRQGFLQPHQLFAGLVGHLGGGGDLEPHGFHHLARLGGGERPWSVRVRR